MTAKSVGATVVGAARASERVKVVSEEHGGRVRAAVNWVLRSPVRMLLLIAVLVGMPINVYAQVLTEDARDSFREAELEDIESGAKSGAEIVSDHMTNIVVRAASVSQTMRLRQLIETPDAAALELLLAAQLSLYANDVERVYVLDVSGRFVASYPPERDLVGVDFSRTSSYIEATGYWPVVSPVTRTEFPTGTATVTVAIPIYSARGEKIAVYCAALSLLRLHEWLEPIADVFDEVYVVDQHGRVVFGDWRVDSTLMRDLTGDPNVAAVLAGHPVRGESFDRFSGEVRLLSGSPVSSLPWAVFVGDSPAPTMRRLSHLIDGLTYLRLILLALLLVGGVLLSVTTLRQQRIALAHLTSLNQAKSEFVSVVSHEFRTPLTGIQGFSEMIRDDDLTTDEVKELANDINLDAQRLARMIGEMLDLDRMESGRMTLNREQMDLTPIIQHAVALQVPIATKHQLALELDPALPSLWGDRDRITQVVTNLLSNAIKYSPDGGTVTVGARTEKDMIHIWVRDEGMGIPSEKLEEVFERYSRIDTTKTRTIEGTGLGLPIVREICKMHGGSAWAESTVGAGSTFHVTLPIDRRGGGR